MIPVVPIITDTLFFYVPHALYCHCKVSVF